MMEKNRRYFLYSFIIIMLIILYSPTDNATAALFYLSNNGTRANGESISDDWTNHNCYPTLAAVFPQMSSGDELVIDDGIYLGDDNKINAGMQYPPDGTPDQYTIVRAKNEGGVMFGTDSAGADWMFPILR